MEKEKLVAGDVANRLYESSDLFVWAVIRQNKVASTAALDSVAGNVETAMKEGGRPYSLSDIQSATRDYPWNKRN